MREEDGRNEVLRPTEVFSQHPHRASRGRITLSPHPLPPSGPIPVRSFPKAILASLTADDNLQPDIHTLYIFLTICTPCLQSRQTLYMVVILASIIIRYHM